jgi:hypothetical protein
LYHTGITQCCSYALDDRQCHSNGPISQVVQWLHAISWRLHITGKGRQGALEKTIKAQDEMLELNKKVRNPRRVTGAWQKRATTGF